MPVSEPQDQNDRLKRIAALSPEQRQLLTRLLAGGRHQEPGTPRDAAAAPAEEPGGSIQSFYNTLNRNLDATEFSEHAIFLNFGYVPNGGPRASVVSLAPQALNRNSMELVLELIGDTPLQGQTVLDIGCGRGGTLWIANTYFAPGRTVGLDLSAGAVRFCRSTHRFPGLSFVNGDAQRLPFPDRAFDIVTNVESSCTYPDVAAFYREVHRVLTPGGAFLYTDYFQRERLTPALSTLQSFGFAIEIERDVTANVMLSRDQTAIRNQTALAAAPSSDVMSNFLGTPESDIYRLMRDGKAVYAIYRLRKV